VAAPETVPPGASPAYRAMQARFSVPGSIPGASTSQARGNGHFWREQVPTRGCVQLLPVRGPDGPDAAPSAARTAEHSALGVEVALRVCWLGFHV
jgi:hypothetical protein